MPARYEGYAVTKQSRSSHAAVTQQGHAEWDEIEQDSCATVRNLLSFTFLIILMVLEMQSCACQQNNFKVLPVKVHVCIVV